MGKQSARIFFQGKDHKDIYFNGYYHDKMYIGSMLVWEKIESSKWIFRYHTEFRLNNFDCLEAGNGIFLTCLLNPTTHEYNEYTEKTFIMTSRDCVNWNLYKYDFDIVGYGLETLIFKNGYFNFINTSYWSSEMYYRTTDGSDLEKVELDNIEIMIDNKIIPSDAVHIFQIIRLDGDICAYLSVRSINLDNCLYIGGFILFTDDFIHWKSTATIKVRKNSSNSYQYLVYSKLGIMENYLYNFFKIEDEYFLSAFVNDEVEGYVKRKLVPLIKTKDFYSYEEICLSEGYISRDGTPRILNATSTATGKNHLFEFSDSENGKKYTTDFVNFYSDLTEIIKFKTQPEILSKASVVELVGGYDAGSNKIYVIKASVFSVDNYGNSQIYISFMFVACDADNNVLYYEESNRKSIPGTYPYIRCCNNICMIINVQSGFIGYLYTKINGI